MAANDQSAGGAPSNRAERRAQERNRRGHQRKARANAKRKGCTCEPELITSPQDGSSVWCLEAESMRPAYVVRHAPTCPLWLARDPNQWAIVTASIPPRLQGQ